MKNLVLIALLGCALFALPAASQVTSLECIARVASPTATGRHPQIVRNGDFRVTGNESYPEIGDSFNEQTRWTCDLSRQLDISTVESFKVHAAVLNLILITKEEGWFHTDTVNIVGLPAIHDPTIRGRTKNSKTNVDIDLLNHYDPCDITSKLKENNGKIDLFYSDDSTVSYAALKIDLRPTASQLTGVEIVEAQSRKPFPDKEIAIGESFRVRLTFAQEPCDEISEIATIRTSDGAAQKVRVTGNSRVIVSEPILVAPSEQ